jgi:hypothetical protein
MTFTMKEERELKKSLRLCVYVSRYVCVCFYSLLSLNFQFVTGSQLSRAG